MGENKISQENARSQIDSLLDYFGIDKTDIEIEDGVEVVQTMFNTLARAIRRGELEITVEGGDLKVTHHLKMETENTNDIIYLDKVGKARMAMENISSKYPQQRMYSFMSALSGVPVSELMKLKGSDVTIFNRLSTVFSMV